MINHEAKYTISIKALEKWSNEHLTVNELDNQEIEGIFRYSGKTCSNLGHELQFLYTVRLIRSVEGYQIISLNCNPEDDGYKYMCAYLEDQENLLEEITGEKPLLHKNLDEVLNWKRKFSPEGCYCNPGSRSHKWGIVLEVLHYALVNLKKKTSSFSE